MDDIYGDLCNYEDVNALQELRDENKELKVKLEEHSAAMEKLQKEILQDYDTLEMEFQKLQNNYSSLLMTARAEIQRKTERITQLNTEKDFMVLNALKSGKKIRRDFNQGLKNPGRMNYDKALERGNNKNKENNVKQKNDDIKQKNDDIKQKNDDIKQKNDDIKHERREKPVLPPKDADTDSGTRNRNKSDNAGVKVELSSNRKSSVSGNIAQYKTELNEPPKTSASSIKDRRKSMPAVSIPPDVFSSDDELERNNKTKDTRTDHLQSDNGRRNINKMPIDRYSNKTSETSSVDDRGHNNPESTSRDNYKGRSSRHHDSTTYRGRDKYEISLKYRKQYSPERGHKRQYREHQDDYHRHERGRYQGRSLESPPPESYNRHQRQKSDFRPDYDRYSHDHEKSRHHHDSKYSSKYRSKDHDEPHTKRQRIESYSKPDGHSKEGWSHYHERESLDAQPAPNFSPHEYDMLRFSCQSPDSVYIDAALANPIKEIMATAATPLEDPRVTSKRYVIWKENGIETLSTSVGRNIDIRPVNKAVWDIKPVDIPVALVRRPSQCSDTLINYIYMDIDNPVNLSMESGEVRVTDDEIHVIRNTPKEIQHDTQDFKIRKHVTEDILKQATDIERVLNPNIAKYRIPKNGQNNKNTHSKMDVPFIDVDENVPHHKNVYRKGAAEDSFPKELLTHKQQYNKREERVNVKDNLPNNKNHSKIEGNKKSRPRERGDHQNQATLTKIAIVADDLELSDENSDHNMDSNRKVVSDKFKKKCEMPLNINQTRTDDSVNYVVNKTLISSRNTKIEKTVDTAEIKDVAEEEKTKESDSTKKQKSKKKKSKSKVISKDSVETTADAIQVPEKKPKLKKEKESKPKETKEKFSDLFGDSNSLMTPEDLGIPSYLPISEDAQDAVDMKINQIIDAAPVIDKDEIPSDTQTQNRVEVKIQETKAHDIPKVVSQISNTDEQDKEVVNEIKKKKSSKRNEEIIDPNELPSPIIYETLNPGTDLNDPNVVKTVIISTGIQPEITYENKLEVTNPATNVEVSAIQNTKDIHLVPATKEFKRDILKALATSTPQKEFSAVNPLQADDAKSDVICDPCVSKAVSTITNTEQLVNQTEKNTLEFNDAPDVRIFVKRRRKVLKRPPMT